MNRWDRPFLIGGDFDMWGEGNDALRFVEC